MRVMWLVVMVLALVCTKKPIIRYEDDYNDEIDLNIDTDSDDDGEFSVNLESLSDEMEQDEDEEYESMTEIDIIDSSDSSESEFTQVLDDEDEGEEEEIIQIKNIKKTQQQKKRQNLESLEKKFVTEVKQKQTEMKPIHQVIPQQNKQQEVQEQKKSNTRKRIDGKLEKPAIFIQTEQIQQNNEQPIKQQKEQSKDRSPQPTKQIEEIQMEQPKQPSHINPYLEQHQQSRSKEIQLQPQTLDNLFQQKEVPKKVQSNELTEALKQIEELKKQMQEVVQVNSRLQQKQLIEEVSLTAQKTAPVIIEQKQIQIKKPIEYDEGMIHCDQRGPEACSHCRSEKAYKIEEENWYLIALQHNYKKEFQVLLDDVRSLLGESELYMAFSLENYICFSSDSVETKVNVNDVLIYFTDATVDDFTQHSHLINVPERLDVASFSFQANYQNRRFYFERFQIDLEGKEQVGLLQLSTYQFTKENAQFASAFTGAINRLPFSLALNTSNRSTRLELSRATDDVEAVKALSEQYLGQVYTEKIVKYLQRSHPQPKQLVVTTQMKEKFEVHFHLKRE